MMKKVILLTSISLWLFSGCTPQKNAAIEDDSLGFINADVTDEDTNLKIKAKYVENMPGRGASFDRSFENAPPMIPHTTVGFLPIKIGKNACLSCHLPEKAKKTKATPVGKTHFANLRKYMVKRGDKFENPVEDMKIETLAKFNNAYYNCSQCHAPLTTVKVDIENLFTPEFRKEFGINASNLKDNFNEGVAN